MFTNIGKKIMMLARVLCWLGIAASVVCGCALAAAGIVGAEGTLPVLLGVVTSVLGSVLSWVGSFCIYGFGQLVENTTKIADHLTDRDTF